MLKTPIPVGIMSLSLLLSIFGCVVSLWYLTFPLRLRLKTRRSRSHRAHIRLVSDERIPGPQPTVYLLGFHVVPTTRSRGLTIIASMKCARYSEYGNARLLSTIIKNMSHQGYSKVLTQQRGDSGMI